MLKSLKELKEEFKLNGDTLLMSSSPAPQSAAAALEPQPAVQQDGHAALRDVYERMRQANAAAQAADLANMQQQALLGQLQATRTKMSEDLKNLIDPAKARAVSGSSPARSYEEEKVILRRMLGTSSLKNGPRG